MGNTAAGSTLQALIKTAMTEAATRVDVNAEAMRQEKTAEKEKCAKCGGDKHDGACKEKTASADAIEKLASALDFVADVIVKEGSMGGPYSLTEKLQTSPPGVSQATASTSLPDKKGQGVNVVPMHPGSEKGLSTEHGSTKVETNLAHGTPGKMPPNIVSGSKHASALSFIKTKLAASGAEAKETKGLEKAEKGIELAAKAHASEPENKGKEAGVVSLADHLLAKKAAAKLAEDAINPAQISAGKEVPPQTSAAGQPGGAPAGGMPQGPTSHIASNKAAINANKAETHGPRREELAKYFKEPALSMAHDSVLRDAFTHTGQAGTKFASEGKEASATSIKTAAAATLLSRLAADAAAVQAEGAAR